MSNILIVEDDIVLCSGIQICLKNYTNNIYKAHNIKMAFQIIDNKQLDLIILDINLPDGDGILFLKQIKKMYDITIILLTAKDLETDVVIGLESGASDYITKPFSLDILRARVNVQLKNSNQIFKNDKFLFDFEKIIFTVNKNRIKLSKTEQKLLKILVQNKGNIVTRDILLEKVYKNDIDYVDNNALSVTVKRLRTKLFDDSCIKTVYGIGYIWVNNYV